MEKIQNEENKLDQNVETTVVEGPVERVTWKGDVEAMQEMKSQERKPDQ